MRVWLRPVLTSCLLMILFSPWQAAAARQEQNKKELSKRDILNNIRQYRKNHEHTIFNEFVELLSIPNVSGDKENVRKNALFIAQLMKKHGLDARVLETKGNPVVYGELNVPGAARTLLFYVHYDGQPVDPAKWTDSLPFHPALRPGKLEADTDLPKPIPLPAPGESFDENWRIYARGASDDKAPIICLLTALDALIASGIGLKNNLKFIFEGEEEAGSTNLRPFLEKNKALLTTDVLFMCDGPCYFSGEPTFFFGVRGITSLEIKVYGPDTNLHSGHYGNWAPNPAIGLARLLASMKDGNGKVTITGFYDTVTPLSPLELKVLKEIPGYENELKELYGFCRAENPGWSLVEAIQYPSLNINGLSSGWVGDDARTIIPSDAAASIDIRLTMGNTAEYMTEKVIEHIKRQGYHVVWEEPGKDVRRKYPLLAKVTVRERGYRASRTSMDLPVSRALLNALDGYSEEKPVLLPSLGGSLPIYVFDETLGVPVIGISIANYDNNQHQPNENIRMGNLWRGIETFTAVFLME